MIPHVAKAFYYAKLHDTSQEAYGPETLALDLQTW
jgi:hypothetical protein